jgi:hypothetical protein
MASTLQRLYKTKLTLLAVLLTVLGAALLAVNAGLASHPGWQWLNSLRLVEVGVALLTGGALAVALQYVAKRDADEALRFELRAAIHSEAPAIRDAVVHGFAFAPDALVNVASEATLDRIVRNTLAIRLGDAQLADAAYRGLREQVLRSTARHYDERVSIVLTPWLDGPPSSKGSMFVVTVHWEFRTKQLQPTMRFACVSDLDEYRELIADTTNVFTWFFEPVAGLSGSSFEAFELTSFSVDGKQLPSRRSARRDAQIYTVGTKDAVPGSGAHVAYTFRGLIQRRSHLLHLDFTKLSKGLNVEFFYGGCGIKHVNVLDYFSGSEQPKITASKSSDPSPAVALSLDSWVMPKSGVGFVWVLESEYQARGQLGRAETTPRRPA